MELKFTGNVVEAVACVQEIVQIGRSGQLESKKKEVIDHGLWAAGHFSAAFFPDDQPPTVGAVGSVDECLKAIEEKCPETVDGQVAVEGIADYYQLFQLLMQLLELLRK